MDLKQPKYWKLRQDERRALAHSVDTCGICGRAFEAHGLRRHLDHHHASDYVRGVLCPSCNVRLWYAEEGTSTLLPAERAYLARAGFPAPSEKVELPPRLIAAMRDLAIAHGRTLSDEIQHALQQYISEEEAR